MSTIDFKGVTSFGLSLVQENVIRATDKIVTKDRI
jgi:hypothetical protein